ncbi:hypothetical protein CISG_07412 [Coccidioides immitis RMSCC 3703]|uniref:Uncharacterized protein n=2 Tax=Coccidioides immitis TaxID=5501 RepID=A0A0J8R3F0_COCIT|nr:hypothetical protein CIRG_03869 [Coccidioides immitis RMSCC 2394]KMU78895.1 hypothetical protein CISG_07412 [Coccidioides immitis RMSCC 3703]
MWITSLLSWASLFVPGPADFLPSYPPTNIMWSHGYFDVTLEQGAAMVLNGAWMMTRGDPPLIAPETRFASLGGFAEDEAFAKQCHPRFARESLIDCKRYEGCFVSLLFYSRTEIFILSVPRVDALEQPCGSTAEDRRTRTNSRPNVEKKGTPLRRPEDQSEGGNPRVRVTTLARVNSNVQ